MDRPDVSGELRSICEKLGLDPKRVHRLEITPCEAIAHVYVPDEEGVLRLTSKGVVPVATVTTTIRT